MTNLPQRERAQNQYTANLQTSPNYFTVKHVFERDSNYSDALITIHICQATHTAPKTESDVDRRTVSPIEFLDFTRNARTGSPKIAKFEDVESIREDATSPSTSLEIKQKWNSPSINMWRTFATSSSFFVMGMNDESYGVSFRHLAGSRKN